MKKLTIIFTVLGVLLLTSCEDFLDVKPSDSAAAETSITNANDAQIVMNGLMRKMAAADYYGRNFVIYGDAKGGDFAIRSQGRGLDALYSFNHSVSSNNYGGYWSQMYHCILQANNLLLNIKKIEDAGNGTTALSQIKGQALTARALIYFDLVRVYGKPYNMDKTSYGVPLILEPLDASDQPLRATVEQVYTQIMADLTEGAPLLPTTKKNGFLNYFGNMALQAKVNLFMEKYPEALAAAEIVTSSSLYTLYSNTNWVSSWATAFSSESIFELGIYANEANLGTGSLGYYLLRLAKVTGASGWFMASDYFLARLNEDPTDIRKGIMDYDESSPTRFGSCLKYVGGSAMLGDKGGVAAATNIKVIRLSEVHLIAAEAALNLPTPDKVKAALYLNNIRKRAPALALATDATVTMDMIADERSKELFAEGHRFFDMMRWNKTIEFNDDFIFPAVIISHREKTIDRTFYKTILPIPQNEIDANPAIAEQQNPEY
jgi:starch-binding outer membrane protein, SusD/RagB family